MNRFKLILFSDIHYLDKRPEKTDWVLDRKLTQYSEKLVDIMIDKINNEYKPNLSVCLGDLIEDQFNYEQDLKNYKYIWDKLKNIKVPFYSVIGNHDLRTINSRKVLEDIMEYKNATFSFDLDGYHFIILSTDVMENVNIENSVLNRYKNISKEEIMRII